MKKNKDISLDELLGLISPMEQNETDEMIAMVGRIRAVMEEKGIDQTELAKRLNKYPSEISRVLSTVHNPTIRTIFNMAFVLEINVWEFFKTRPTIKISKPHMVSLDSLVSLMHMGKTVESIEKMSSIESKKYYYKHEPSC